MVNDMKKVQYVQENGIEGLSWHENALIFVFIIVFRLITFKYSV